MQVVKLIADAEEHSGADRATMTALPVSDNGVEDPLQEVQSLQKDLKAFSRAVNKPLRDNIIYPTFTLASPQSSRKGLPISQNPGDVAILDRLKIIRGLPGKARTSALVRQALTLQDSNVRAPSTSSTPPVSQRHRKESAQQTPRLDQAGIPTDSFAPVTAADFQDQLYDASGAIDLTRVRLKIKQHQQDLIAAGLQAPPEEPGPAVLEGAPQEALQAKLHWQLAAGQRNPASGANYTLRYHSAHLVSATLSHQSAQRLPQAACRQYHRQTMNLTISVLLAVSMRRRRHIHRTGHIRASSGKMSRQLARLKWVPQHTLAAWTVHAVTCAKAAALSLCACLLARLLVLAVESHMLPMSCLASCRDCKPAAANGH